MRDNDCPHNDYCLRCDYRKRESCVINLIVWLFVDVLVIEIVYRALRYLNLV